MKPPAMSPCPNPERLRDLIDDRLGESETAALSDHLESCDRCQRLLEAPAPRHSPRGTAAGGAGVPDETTDPSPFIERFATQPPPGADRPEDSATGPWIEAGGRIEPPMGYSLLGELGRGGMSVVYLAHHEQLDRPAALKVLIGGPFADTSLRQRLANEAKAIARLSHPNVVGIYEVGRWHGQTFLALEYVPGRTLRDRFAEGPMPPDEAVGLITTLAGAVEAVHRNGIVHRDLKPANVLLAEDGSPKVTDFGIAKLADDATPLTVTGSLMGTPEYMAPEQAAGEVRRVGPATDIHALGLMLYEALAGVSPFRTASTEETLRRVRTTAPRRIPGVPASLEAICLRCLAKRPADRYPSAAALADDLRAFLAGGGRKGGRPTRRGWLIGAAAAVILGGVAAVSLWPGCSGDPTGTVASGDPLAEGSVWAGTFEFLPPYAPYTGTVELRITGRDGDTFRGVYRSEGKYSWKAEGTLRGTAITWEFTEVITDNPTRDVVGLAYVKGTLADGEMKVEFLRRNDPACRGSMTLHREPGGD